MPTLRDVAGELSFLDGTEPPADCLGARPRDGEAVGINPPALAWVPERGSVAFDLEVSRTSDFTGEAVVRSERLTLNLQTFPEAFAEGRWHWRYRCHLEGGGLTGWSVARSFTIAADAARVPVPPVADLKARLASGHPRLYARPETLPALRQRAQDQPERWDRLLEVTTEKLAHPLMPEPALYPNGQWDVNIWRNYLVQARNMSSAVDHLAFGYVMTADRRYGEKLREWLCHLSRWDPQGTSSYKYNDEVGMPVLFVLARGYDCGHDVLTDDERELVRTALARRADEVYGMFRQKNPYEVRPYDNHATRTINFLGQAGLSLLGEVDAAEEWLDYVLKVYVAFYPPWGGDDGGYSQGPMYLAAYLNWMLQFLFFLENATGIDFHQKPFFRNVGNFILYGEPYFARMTPFGDGMTRQPGRLSQLNMYRLAQKFREPTFQWHAQQMRAAQMTVETVPADLLDFLWRDESIPANPPAEHAHCFTSVGVAALHSDLSDAPDDVYLLFKSSPFGAWSHAYADQNTFYIHGFGQPLAICSGYYPWYGSEHHTQWTWQSKAHNSILVDGEGQVAGTRASRGKIDRFVTSEWFDYCRGDAIEAYGGWLTRCFRHVLYVKETNGPGWFVIADDVASPKAATFQWLLHALSQMAVDKETRTVMITGQEAHLRVSFLTPEDLVFDQTDQFEPAPEPSEARRSFPNQWHLSARTGSAQPHVGFLVVLEPYRAQMEMSSTCQVVEAPGWVAGRVETSEGEVLVGLRQGDGGAAVDGVETDAAFFALQRRPEERVARVLICDGSFLKVDGKASVAWQACRTDVVELKW